MKLGNDTIGVRTRQTRVDGDGKPVTDEFGDELLDVVDVEVRWCLVAPTRRVGQNEEPENRTAPTIQGMTVLAPSGTVADAKDLIIWPITGSTGSAEGGDLRLEGKEWQIVGEPAPWPECLEVQIRAAS